MTDIDVSQMTPEQRLKQIEILLSIAAKSINQSNERMSKLEAVVAANQVAANERMSKLEQNLAIISDLVWSTAKVVAEQREEIKASQAECQRIWQYLMSQTDNGKGKGES